MPLNGLLAYVNELSPVALDQGDETDLAYQDADGDLSGDPVTGPGGALAALFGGMGGNPLNPLLMGLQPDPEEEEEDLGALAR